MLRDKDIREPLFEFLEDKFDKIRIIEEKQIAKSRADVMVVLPDSLVGIEIKSDADTCARLEKQVKDYNRFFDFNYLVVGSTHARHAAENVPDFWGIISAEELEAGIDFLVLREPSENKKAQKTYKMKRKLSLLWRPELAHLQEINNMPKYKQRSKNFVINKIMEKVDWNTLHSQISEELFERDYNTINEIIAKYKHK